MDLIKHLQSLKELENEQQRLKAEAGKLLNPISLPDFIPYEEACVMSRQPEYAKILTDNYAQCSTKAGYELMTPEVIRISRLERRVASLELALKNFNVGRSPADRIVVNDREQRKDYHLNTLASDGTRKA